MSPSFVCPPLVPTQLLTNHYERCWKYYCLPTGWANYGVTSEEELHLTRKLFWGIFDSLAHKVWAPEGPERSLFGGSGARSQGSRMKSSKLGVQGGRQFCRFGSRRIYELGLWFEHYGRGNGPLVWGFGGGNIGVV